LKWHDSQYLALKTADKVKYEQQVTPNSAAKTIVPGIEVTQQRQTWIGAAGMLAAVSRPPFHHAGVIRGRRLSPVKPARRFMLDGENLANFCHSF
jgi:hypothetical protein